MQGLHCTRVADAKYVTARHNTEHHAPYQTACFTAPPNTPHIALILHSPRFSYCLLSFLFSFYSMTLLPSPPLRNELGRGHSVHNAEEHGQQEAGPGRDFRRGELRPRFQNGSQTWILDSWKDLGLYSRDGSCTVIPEREWEISSGEVQGGVL
jgi:hypothetical protein